MEECGRAWKSKEESRRDRITPKQKTERESAETVPSLIFRDRELAPLESVSEYLKEKRGLTYHEIARLLKRDDRTIWTCYNRGKKKRGGKEAQQEQGEKKDIPLEIFHNRELAPLEGISRYLKEVANMSFHEIAVLLNRDDRTIWTCYNRAKKKIAN